MITAFCFILLVLLVILQRYELYKLRSDYEITNNNLMKLAKGLHKKGVIKLFIEGEEQ